MATVPKLIALDMDGTLLNSQKRISSENREALRFWAEKGVLLVLASGRMTPVLENNVKELGLDCLLMGYNGAECVDRITNQREVLFRTPFPDNRINGLIDYCTTHSHYINVYADTGKLHGAPTDESRHYPERYSYLNQATFEYVESLESLRVINPLKCLIIKHDENERDQLHESIIKDSLFTNLHIARTSSHNEKCGQFYLEFMHPEVNKGTGLTKLCNSLGLSLDEVVAFGDANNDLELLQTAGMGICMAQGTPEAKKAANFVSEFTNDQHGVAKELEKLATQFFPSHDI